MVPRRLGGCARRGGTDSRSGAENAPGAMPQRSLAEDAAPACAAREKVLPQQRGQARRTVCRERIAKRRNPTGGAAEILITRSEILAVAA